MAREIDLSLKPFENCPQFHKCNCNDCPLAPRQYKTDPSDPQTRCKMAKAIRVRIGKQYKLRRRGMTPREYSNWKRWQDLPQEEKERRIAALKKVSPLSQCISKGLTVSRKRMAHPTIPHEKEKRSPKTATSQIGETKNGA